MACPHNAVLLCSSHYRVVIPKCTELAFDTQTALTTSTISSTVKGQVKGCIVMEPAREYLNSKKICCMQNDCIFVRSSKELRKHMKADHPCAQPRKAKLTLEKK
ncbi:uncharacterized protein LOC120197601 [Hibiscus syriacus]|uniref:uncharacterized protein LOC120197601 n=1 Tax=Hibiscus syriacus TaxID=106335 RepID=UPI001920D8E9|nr:uncharacterized protein LOC120197601 [Hibiscus syriacus]